MIFSTNNFPVNIVGHWIRTLLLIGLRSNHSDISNCDLLMLDCYAIDVIDAQVTFSFMCVGNSVIRSQTDEGVAIIR